MNKHPLTLADKTAALYTAADHRPENPLVLTFPEPGEEDALAALLPDGITLLTVIEPDWETSFSPWSAPRAFKSGADFSGGAAAYLHMLTDTLLPQAEAALGLQPAWRGLAGYSLAGLFALYTAYHSSAFQRIASVSGSLWFDGWLEFMQTHPTQALPERAYFSVGDTEKNTKNPRMAVVESHTQAAAVLWREAGVPTAFELNPGGHFQDVPERVAKAVVFLANP